MDQALNAAPNLICADGGAQTALEYGFVPQRVIGDMDSLSFSAIQKIPLETIKHLTGQDTTDLDKCVDTVEAPFYVAVGVVHPRLDHGLASLNVLARYKTKKILLLTETDVCFLCPPKLALHLPEGTRLSLFPLGTVRGQSKGLKWSVNEIEFSPVGRIGTSNEVSSQSVELRWQSPLMLAIMPMARFHAVLSAIRTAPCWTEE